jgi:hypothetical protein
LDCEPQSCYATNIVKSENFDCPNTPLPTSIATVFSPLFLADGGILDSQILARNHGIGEKGA